LNDFATTDAARACAKCDDRVHLSDAQQYVNFIASDGRFYELFL
jgi:hypothetical protein